MPKKILLTLLIEIDINIYKTGFIGMSEARALALLNQTQAQLNFRAAHLFAEYMA